MDDPRDALAEQIRDVLAHFFDYPYLAQHPLLQRFRFRVGPDAMTAVHQLRRLLLEAIESLQPARDLPPEEPAWRPYQALYNRYVLGQDLDELEAALGLSRRQIQREQRRALDTLVLMLSDSQPPFGQPTAEALWAEISRIAVQQESFEVGEQVARALESAAALAQAQGTPIAYSPPECALHLSGSPALFRQLLLALLSCLLRHSHVERLELGLRRDAGRIVCSLQPDLSSDAPPPFPLPDTVTALAKAQRAQIVSESDGAGWRVNMLLPIAKAPSTVAILEDNDDVVALFQRYLEGRPYRLVRVEQVERTVEAIAETEADVVLLDVMMPGVDGWEVLRALKAHPRLRRVPVVVCSILDEPELAASLGAQAFLRKPVRPAQLVDCLSSVLTGAT